MYCATCGSQIANGANFCPNCGKPAVQAPPIQTSKVPGQNRERRAVNGIIVTAILLIVVFGVLSRNSQPSTTRHAPPTRTTTKGVIRTAPPTATDETKVVPKELADLKAVGGLLNQSGQIVTGYAISRTAATLQIDGNAWEPMSDQDKRLLEQSLERAWSITWDQHHTPHEATTLQFYMEDLSSDRLFSDEITLPDTNHAERAAFEKERLSGGGAYNVVEQWSWCGDGIGQRAIVVSHNPNDLVPAFHRFLSSLNGDRSKCIMFEVFTDQATLDQSKSVSDEYPDSELVHQWTHELQYTNNPNTGLEEWDFGVKTLPDGTHDFVQHVVHPATN